MTKVDACVPRGGALLSDWLDRPLCRRYESAIFDVATVRLCVADGLARRRVRWAFGWLADGECEALGGWMDPADGTPDPRQLLAGLQARGLERIRYLAGPGTGSVPDPMPQPTLLQAAQVRVRLARAIRRHGCFETEAAVLDFVSDALQRAERRLDRERLIAKGKLRLDPGVRMAPLAI
jgi:transposase-like protein